MIILIPKQLHSPKTLPKSSTYLVSFCRLANCANQIKGVDNRKLLGHFANSNQDIIGHRFVYGRTEIALNCARFCIIRLPSEIRKGCLVAKLRDVDKLDSVIETSWHSYHQTVVGSGKC